MARESGQKSLTSRIEFTTSQKERNMPIILWLLGMPIGLIILLMLFFH